MLVAWGWEKSLLAGGIKCQDEKLRRSKCYHTMAIVGTTRELHIRRCMARCAHALDMDKSAWQATLWLKDG